MRTSSSSRCAWPETIRNRARARSRTSSNVELEQSEVAWTSTSGSLPGRAMTAAPTSKLTLRSRARGSIPVRCAYDLGSAASSTADRPPSGCSAAASLRWACGTTWSSSVRIAAAYPSVPTVTAGSSRNSARSLGTSASGAAITAGMPGKTSRTRLTTSSAVRPAANTTAGSRPAAASVASCGVDTAVIREDDPSRCRSPVATSGSSVTASTLGAVELSLTARGPGAARPSAACTSSSSAARKRRTASFPGPLPGVVPLASQLRRMRSTRPRISAASGDSMRSMPVASISTTL